MHEGLNHWTFVFAAYAIGVAGTALLVLSSVLAMRRAETRRDRAREQ
jgi:heme exporter protein D